MTRVTAGAGRFVFIDALRGIAALGVVMNHAFVFTEIGGAATRWLPAIARLVILDYSRRGVQIFFVISGFVIAHSLRKTPINLSNAARFIARRQLRLDPPYWMALILSLIRLAARLNVPGVGYKAFPTPVQILANFTYTSMFFGWIPIVNVAWTLSIEVQFYLAFVLILAVARRPGPTPVAMALVLLTGVAALVLDPNVTWEARWAGHTWPFFAAGVLCYWATQGSGAATGSLAVLAASLLGSCLKFGLTSQVVTGVATAGAIYGVGALGKLQTWANYRPLQFLGRISYSLYLTHILVTVSVQQLAYKLTHDNAPAAVVWCLLAILIAIAVAYPFHLYIELPSMRWATRFKMDPGPSAATGFGEEIPPIEDIQGDTAKSTHAT